MASAFVLVNADTGRERDVLQTLRRISGVSEAHVAYGGFDILAKVEVESSGSVKQIRLFKDTQAGECEVNSHTCGSGLKSDCSVIK